MDRLTANWLGALTAAVDAQVADAVGAHTGTEMAAVLTCSHFPQTTVGELAQILGLTGSGAVRLVDRLERDGLVRRRAGTDRRVMVSLSRRGRRRAGELQRHRLQAIDGLLSVLSPDERAQLGALLEALLFRASLGAEWARRVCRFCDHARCDGERCPVGRSVRARGEDPAP